MIFPQNMFRVWMHYCVSSKTIAALCILLTISAIITISVHAGLPASQQAAPQRVHDIDLGDGVMIRCVYIPPGVFTMGSDELPGTFPPPKRVTINDGFYMSIYEVTQEQYSHIMDMPIGPGTPQATPAHSVTWNDAMRFCQLATQRAVGGAFRLPTEAEWEYACRAGTTTLFNTGDTITDEQANYNAEFTFLGGIKGRFRRERLPVGSFQPNAFGLYDMHGNVEEWCSDAWVPDDAEEANSTPTRSETPLRVVRGGGYASGPVCLVSAFRMACDANSRSPESGFRVVFVPDKQLRQTAASLHGE